MIAMCPMRSVSTAIIPAGGEGTRMQPLTRLMPKAALAIAGIPNIQRIVRSIGRELGVNNHYVTSHHLAWEVLRAVGLGSDGVRIHHLVEQAESDSVQSTHTIVNNFGKNETFVLNAGDAVQPESRYKDLYRAFHRAVNESRHIRAALTCVLRPIDEVVGRYPPVVIDENGLAVEFPDRPMNSTEAQKIFGRITYDPVQQASDIVGRELLPVSTLQMIAYKSIFPRDLENPKQKWEWGFDIFRMVRPGTIAAYILPEIMARGEVVGSWTDLCYPEDLLRANFRFVQFAAAKLTLEGFDYNEKINSFVHRTAQVLGRIANCFVGAYAKIGPGVSATHTFFQPYSVVRGERTEVRRSIISPFSQLNASRHSSEIRFITDSIVGAGNFNSNFDFETIGRRDEIIRQVIVQNPDNTYTTVEMNRLTEADKELALRSFRSHGKQLGILSE